MKKTYKYIALAVLAIGFTACSQDDDFATQQEDIVKIASANIATEVQSRVNTLDKGTVWENGDRILLVNNSRNNKNSGTYEATVTTGDNPTTTWELKDGIVLYQSSGTNNFTAYYPASVDFTLPIDQSTEAGIKSADRMIATTDDVTKGEAVALSFERQNAKVTIIPHLNTEFDSNTAGISSLTIAGITPYSVNSKDYTAIIEPTSDGFTVKVKVGDNDPLTATTSTQIEAGKHYTFDLTVGKVAVSIAALSVSQWNVIEVSDVETETYPNNYVNATSMPENELEAALLSLFPSCSNIDVTVILANNAGIWMFNAITNALKNRNTPSDINLTIVGVKTIPANAFGNPEEEEIAGPTTLKTLKLPDAVKLENNSLCLPEVEAIYVPNVTEWQGTAIRNEYYTLKTLFLTTQENITGDPDLTYLSTTYIDLTLNENKRSETDGNKWKGKTWKSITFAE